MCQDSWRREQKICLFSSLLRRRKRRRRKKRRKRRRKRRRTINLARRQFLFNRGRKKYFMVIFLWEISVRAFLLFFLPRKTDIRNINLRMQIESSGVWRGRGEGEREKKEAAVDFFSAIKNRWKLEGEGGGGGEEKSKLRENVSWHGETKRNGGDSDIRIRKKKNEKSEMLLRLMNSSSSFYLFSSPISLFLENEEKVFLGLVRKIKRRRRSRDRISRVSMAV